MDVYEAVDSRRAVRAFSDEPVSKEGHVYVVTGEPLAELKRRATARALAGDPADGREYPMYPVGLGPPCLDRFSAAAAKP